MIFRATMMRLVAAARVEPDKQAWIAAATLPQLTYATAR